MKSAFRKLNWAGKILSEHEIQPSHQEKQSKCNHISQALGEKRWGTWMVAEHISLVHIPVNAFRATRPLKDTPTPPSSHFQMDSQVVWLSSECHSDQEPSFSLSRLLSARLPFGTSTTHTAANTSCPPHVSPSPCQASCLWLPTNLPHHLPGVRFPQCPPQCSLPLGDLPTAGYTCLHLFASGLSLVMEPCSPHTARWAGESTPLLATPAPTLSAWLQKVGINTPTSSSLGQLEDACSMFYTGPGLFRRIKFQFSTGVIHLMHLLLTTFPSLSHFPVSLWAFPGVSSQIHSLHLNAWGRPCFCVYAM